MNTHAGSSGQGSGLGPLLWSGEHWIAYLREGGERGTEGRAGASISLYHAYDSPAGEGTVAFVATDALTAVCTDNPALAEFARDRLVIRRVSPIDPDAEILEASLTRVGEVRRTPGWRIEAADHVIAAEWAELGAAIVGPTTASPSICFTILYFAAEGAIAVDGEPMPGRAYPRDAWTKTLGRPMSSFCFALSETMLDT